MLLIGCLLLFKLSYRKMHQAICSITFYTNQYPLLKFYLYLLKTLKYCRSHNQSLINFLAELFSFLKSNHRTTILLNISEFLTKQKLYFSLGNRLQLRANELKSNKVTLRLTLSRYKLLKDHSSDKGP